MRLFYVFSLLSVLTANSGYGAQIVDDKTVYSPDLNTCVASFGGLIHTPETQVLPNFKPRLLLAKKLLVRWIHEKNDAGFYLRELDSSHFYWQFVETKKYLGALLLVSGDLIRPTFYSSLGSGLPVPGEELYRPDMPWLSNTDVFSFVINKETHTLDHFENWRFSDRNATLKWMTKSAQHDLAALLGY